MSPYPSDEDTEAKNAASSGVASPRTADVALILLDPHGLIVSWTAGAERITGYACDEVLGKSCGQLYGLGPDNDRACLRDLDAATTHGEIEVDVWRSRKDGTRFLAHEITTALREPGTGQITGFARVVRVDRREDGKPKRSAESDEDRFRLLVEGVKDYAIFMLDVTGHVSSWNAGAERIKGYKAHEIIGQHFSKFYPDEDNQAGKPAFELETATREGRFEDEGWRIRNDGSRFWANVVITALFDQSGRLVAFGKVTRDLTDRRRLEDERLQRAQMEEALRLRDEFISIASHELKTPLTALQLQLDGVRARAENLDAGLSQRLARATKSADRLSDLIDTLLDVSRIASGRFELKREQFVLADAVQEVVERLRDAAKRAGCEVWLQLGEGIVGTWDRLRVEQIVTNLLANAFKYASGSPVAISVTRAPREAVLQIRDRGPGIPDADLARIFGRFERSASVRHYGGMGLGLYVTRQIVEAHGGTIGVENAPGGGACFTVRMPLEPASERDRKAGTA